ncbi:hypothetical protein [Embleya sp. NPDC059237]|uniref:hypothetical protein n=1 Tax=Embleya sp. NPDC059237 TaxID=3346784 RepID=UPI0036822CEA
MARKRKNTRARDKQARRERVHREQRGSSSQPSEEPPPRGDEPPAPATIAPPVQSAVEAAIDEPVLTPIVGASAENIEVACRYWQWNAYGHGESTLWSEAVNSIATDARSIALTSATLTVPGMACARCDGPLVLSSRAAFDRVYRLANGAEESCAGCDESTQVQLARFAEPKRQARRIEATRAAAVREIEAGFRQAWESARSARISDAYRVELTEDDIPEVDVRTEAVALAMLRYAPGSEVIAPLCEWSTPLSASGDGQSEAVASTVRGGLLRIHPQTSLDTFVWEPTSFDQGLREAEGLHHAVKPPELLNRYRAASATHYSPYGAGLGAAAARLDAHLVARLEPAGMIAPRQGELVATGRRGDHRRGPAILRLRAGPTQPSGRTREPPDPSA